MWITQSARKHGISDADTWHAWRNPVLVRDLEFDHEVRVVVIGPDRVGRLIELVAVPASNPTRIIHAQRARPKFTRLLGEVRRHD